MTKRSCLVTRIGCSDVPTSTFVYLQDPRRELPRRCARTLNDLADRSLGVAVEDAMRVASAEGAKSELRVDIGKRLQILSERLLKMIARQAKCEAWSPEVSPDKVVYEAPLATCDHVMDAE